jgi:hypothetical protein
MEAYALWIEYGDGYSLFFFFFLLFSSLLLTPKDAESSQREGICKLVLTFLMLSRELRENGTLLVYVNSSLSESAST